VANQSNDFCTPPELIEPIKAFWGGKIDLDPCSNKNSLVNAEVSYSLPTNSILTPWSVCPGKTTVFVNPPYAPYYLSPEGVCFTPQEYKALNHPTGFERYTLYSWLCKGVTEKKNGCELIYLIPARGAGSKVWQNVIYPLSDAICFLNKRYPFWENGEPCKVNGKNSGASFDVCLVYFGTEPACFKRHFSKLGYVVIQDRS
jgi:hypothetical protein